MKVSINGVWTGVFSANHFVYHCEIKKQIYKLLINFPLRGSFFGIIDGFWVKNSFLMFFLWPSWYFQVFDIMPKETQRTRDLDSSLILEKREIIKSPVSLNWEGKVDQGLKSVVNNFLLILIDWNVLKHFWVWNCRDFVGFPDSPDFLIISCS